MRNALGCREVSLADEALVAAAGVVPGFLGPIGLQLRVLADLSIQGMRGAVTGANQADMHYVQVDQERDFTPSKFADLRLAVNGDPCPRCDPGQLAMPEIFRGIGPYGDRISFLAVNQGETPPIIEQFLKQRDWVGIPVGLDSRQKIGDQFQVQGIPHTVVIDKEGKIAWVHSGYKEGMADDLFQAIAKALE